MICKNLICLLFSESIYENAAVLKSTNFIKPISSTLEKYEFGQNEDLRSDSLGDESNESVVFQDIEDFDKPASDVESKTISWGVRIGSFPQSPSPRNNNPTEDKIGKEIRELKEREDELIRLREAKTQACNTKPRSSCEQLSFHIKTELHFHSLFNGSWY